MIGSVAPNRLSAFARWISAKVKPISRAFRALNATVSSPSTRAPASASACSAEAAPENLPRDLDDGVGQPALAQLIKDEPRFAPPELEVLGGPAASAQSVPQGQSPLGKWSRPGGDLD